MTFPKSLCMSLAGVTWAVKLMASYPLLSHSFYKAIDLPVTILCELLIPPPPFHWSREDHGKLGTVSLPLVDDTHLGLLVGNHVPLDIMVFDLCTEHALSFQLGVSCAGHLNIKWAEFILRASLQPFTKLPSQFA